jgi:protocatechuate 3,4-dioxygenase beta subunit
VLEPGCAKAAGATARIWHTDSRGLYGPGGGRDECCYYGGTVTADGDGRFRLDTIRPAQYPEPGAPPAHIHLEIRHPAGQLDTEIVFEAGTPPPGPIGPAHVIPVELRRSGEGWYGETAFVLET